MTGRSAKPALLVLTALPADTRAALDARYAIVQAGEGAVPDQVKAGIRAVLTNGMVGIAAPLMAELPSLEIICVRGAGHEAVDVAAAAARGIVVTTGHGTNAETVADHAIALALAVMRGIPAADAGVRAGGWADLRQRPVTLSRKRLGLVGLGAIGSAIASRAAGGFEMAVAYHARSARPGSPYRYVESVLALAEQSDVLVLAAPGGAATRHMVDEAVLTALGPSGFLVNIARGSLVDTDALIAALEAGAIGGAALDVVEGEPNVPDRLRTQVNLVLTPHIAGRSPESVAASLQRVVDNLDAHFAGRPVDSVLSRLSS